jgi:hypothetical protein
MTSVISGLGRACAPRLASIIAVLLFASLAGAASASAELNGEFNGHLPAKTWTTNGAYGSFIYMWGERTSGEGPVCITAAEYSGGWSFPYGWQCNHPQPNPWVFGGTGYPAVDNPNSKEIGFHVGYN